MNALKKIQKLEQQLAELKAQLEPEFEGWVFIDNGNDDIALVMYSNYERTFGFGFGNNSWTEYFNIGNTKKWGYRFTKAPDIRVEERLRKEWARRCKDAGWDDPDEAEIEGHADDYPYGDMEINKGYFSEGYFSGDKLYTKQGCVYHDGKFATPKKRNKLFEWDVEYKSDGRVKIGCKTFSKEELRIISDSLSHVKVNAVSSVLDELKKLDL